MMLTPENARILSEEFIKAIPVFPKCFKGRGIVIPAGGTRYFTCAWVCIKMLRHLGCQLPIELWHMGKQELDITMKQLISSLGVECVDALERMEMYPATISRGWELKAYALLHSAYKDVLLLDADVVPLINPEQLFDAAQFSSLGAILWPDFERFTADHPIWAICGVPYQDEPQIESSQILVNKQISWRSINLSLWYNEHSDFYYNYIHGDKDTFHLAFRKIGQRYLTPHHMVRIENTNCHHDFEGNRIFQHRNQDKWSIFGKNKRVFGFKYEDECFQFLQELKSTWKPAPPFRRYDYSSKSSELRLIAKRIIDRLFIYHRVGYDQRRMRFLYDGTVGEGQAGCEVFWDVTEIDRKIVLTISSDSEITCELNESEGGIWKGHWLRHERMPVELSIIGMVEVRKK